MDTHSEQIKDDLFVDQFHQDGFFVFKKILPLSALQIISDEVTAIRKIVLPKVEKMARPIKTYTDIAERQLGRLDYRCGFTSEVFVDLALPIVNLVKKISPTIDFRYYWGAIPALPGAGPTDLHRDIYPFVNYYIGNNIGPLEMSFPPYYLTVLIPLVHITEENGPTQFVRGSHALPILNEKKAELYGPLLSPGDIVIFDGRTYHQGSANNTKEERIVAYITFVANWYNDQTFILNDYLIPELAMKIR